jgi:hypothetical protein
MFDVTARRAAKREPVGFFPWLLPLLAPELSFASWLDARNEWKRLADLEPDPQVRLQYAGDALIFAELPGVWREWKQALAGWNVKVSQQVLEWQADAQRATLLRQLEKRYKVPVPEELAEQIRTTQDMNLLSRWLDAVVESNTLDEFRAALQSSR